MEFLENRCNVKAVNEQRGAARSVCVREEMEELETAWVGLRRIDFQCECAVQDR
jgi:hypothetical protein